MTRHLEPYYLPERKPRIGFLGAGWIGCLRLEALLQSGQADVQAIADPSRESRETGTLDSRLGAVSRDVSRDDLPNRAWARDAIGSHSLRRHEPTADRHRRLVQGRQ